MGRVSLIIDTNLLVLFVVGSTDRSLIDKHKRLKVFSQEDFDLLCQLIESSPETVVTPNILTEASNLIGHIGEPARTRVFETFRAVIGALSEEYVESSVACQTKEFTRLGLTDVGLLDNTNSARSILTTDWRLYMAAEDRGIPVINFNHLR